MLHEIEIGPDSDYLIDESKTRGEADILLIPETEEDVSEAVRRAHSAHLGITVSGRRTGMCAGSVPHGGYVLSMEKMGRILGVGKDGRGYFVRVQPYVTVRELNAFIRRRGFASAPSVTEGAAEAMAAEEREFFYPVDPTELDGSLGGNIAANASGPRTFRYGPTRNWVRRVRAVLSDGSVIDVKRGDIKADGRHLALPFSDGVREFDLPSYIYNMEVKNTTGMFSEDGMDAVDLFVGSEGIFGIITEADLYLTEAHPLMSNIVFLPGDGDAYALSRDFGESGVVPEFLEFFDSGSLDLIRASRKEDPRFTGMPDIPDYAGSALFFDLPMDGSLAESYGKIEPYIEKHSGSLSRSWCGHEQRDRERFFSFRHSVPQTIFEYVARLKGASAPGINKMGTDMAVPLAHLDEMMAAYDEVITRYGLEYVIFGHIGNGHPHVEIILKDMDDFAKAKKAYAELAHKAIELGGTPSAEHGIGKMKTDYVRMMYGEKGAAEIHAVKDVLDPDWILNPGNMVVR